MSGAFFGGKNTGRVRGGNGEATRTVDINSLVPEGAHRTVDINRPVPEGAHRTVDINSPVRTLRNWAVDINSPVRTLRNRTVDINSPGALPLPPGPARCQGVAVAVDSNSIREQLLSLRVGIESNCSRFQLESRAVLSIRVGIESNCSRFQLESRAIALESSWNREQRGVA